MKEYFDIACNLADVDCVFHLAAQTSVFNTDKEQITHDNITSFISVVDACKRSGVKLVYASSSTAHSPNTTSLYGISKRLNEEYARCYYPEATGVRLHNVYGPDPRQGTLLWHLLHDKEVRLVGNGGNVRHFTYIDDVVEGLIYAMTSDKPLINIANPEERTIFEVALFAQGYNGIDITIVRENREFDKHAQVVDESLFNVPLSYTSIDEGMKRIFERNDCK